MCRWIFTVVVVIWLYTIAALTGVFNTYPTLTWPIIFVFIACVLFGIFRCIAIESSLEARISELEELLLDDEQNDG